MEIIKNNINNMVSLYEIDVGEWFGYEGRVYFKTKEDRFGTITYGYIRTDGIVCPFPDTNIFVIPLKTKLFIEK